MAATAVDDVLAHAAFDQIIARCAVKQVFAVKTANLVIVGAATN